MTENKQIKAVRRATLLLGRLKVGTKTEDNRPMATSDGGIDVH